MGMFLFCGAHIIDFNPDLCSVGEVLVDLANISCGSGTFTPHLINKGSIASS
jgi:hypothetical protein